MRSCAIHQPNLLPRLSTLAKRYAADIWVVLDDVQFACHDYQHRARLAALDGPARQQWLSIETHLPHGRATLIRDARLADPQRATTYLCGTGGMRYLDLRPFMERQLNLHAFRPPAADHGLWTGAAKITALWALAAYGPSGARAAFDDLRASL